MLAIPLKNGSGVALSNSIKIYVANEYSKEDADAIDSDLKSLERMRTMALQARAATDVSLGTLQAYYTQLGQVQALVPVGDTVKINFTWHDAFRPNKKYSESDLTFERASVLFNMGAVKSLIAASADRALGEGLKVACKEFQAAAGMFKLLREQMVPGLKCALPSDLTDEGLMMCESIMLAQAQACFYEKAVADRITTKMKSSIIARLAAQAAEMYLTSLRYAESSSMMAAGLDPSWPSTLRFQQDLFNAAAQFYQSESAKESALESGTGFGEEITRLRVAQALVERSLDTASRQRMGPSIMSKVEQLKAKIVRNRTAAEKDNSTIYLESVPSETSLKPVLKANMVKPLEPDFAPAPQRLFGNLMPKPVKEALSKYEREAGTIASNADQRAKDASKDARQQLSAVGLPGSLEAHESPGGLPEPTWKKIQGLREKQSSPADLEAQVSELGAAGAKVADVFLRVEKTLRDEEQRDRAFREKYGEAWTKVGVASSSLLADTWKELQHFQGLFREAQKSDEYLMGRLQDHEFRSAAAMLHSSRQDLDILLAKGPSVAHAQKIDTRTLSKAMLDLASLLLERDSLIQHLKAAVDNKSAELKSRLLGGEAAQPQAAIQDSLAAVLNIHSAVEASIARQAPIVAKILEENSKFQAARQTEPSTLERERLIQQLENGIVRCHEIHAQVAEGKEFYAAVVKRLQQLQLMAEDQVYTQELQRRDFEVELVKFEERQKQESADADAARRLFDQLNLSQQQQQQPQQGQQPPPGTSPQQPGPSAYQPYAPPPYQSYPPTHPSQAPPSSHGGSSQYGHGPSAYQQQPAQPYGSAPPPYGYPGQQVPYFHQAPAPAQLYQPQAPPPGPPPPYQDYHRQPPQRPQAPTGPAAEEGKVRQLVVMGFEEAKARRALAVNNGDFDAALTSLLTP